MILIMPNYDSILMAVNISKGQKYEISWHLSDQDKYYNILWHWHDEKRIS